MLDRGRPRGRCIPRSSGARQAARGRARFDSSRAHRAGRARQRRFARRALSASRCSWLRTTSVTPAIGERSLVAVEELAHLGGKADGDAPPVSSRPDMSTLETGVSGRSLQVTRGFTKADF